MASLTTRLKINVPDVGDFADEGVYYTPAIALLESEIPSVIKTNLGVPDYDGQIKTTSGDGWSKLTAVAYGGVWHYIGNFGTQAFFSVGLMSFNDYFATAAATQVATYNGSSETFSSNAVNYSTSTVRDFKPTSQFSAKLSTALSHAAVAGTGFVNVLWGATVTPPTPGTQVAITKLPVNFTSSDALSEMLTWEFSLIPSQLYKSFSVYPSSTLAAMTLTSASNPTNKWYSNRISFEEYMR